MTAVDWNPGRIRFVQSLPTSTRVSRVKTDSGYAWVKTMNNPQGPSALVSEFIGYSLARWLRLKTPPFRVHDFGDQSRVIVMVDGQRGAPGPSFVTSEINGRPWDGTEKDIRDNVENTGDVVGLILLDTWLRDVDRYAPFRSQFWNRADNVFLGGRDGSSKRHVVAFDHSEALRDRPGSLHEDICESGRVRDEHVYGAFPALVQCVTAEAKRRFLQRLASFQEADAHQLVEAIPEPWLVSRKVRDAIAAFLCARASFLCVHAVSAISGPPTQLPLLWPTEGHGHG